jgi:hypothetical protein
MKLNCVEVEYMETERTVEGGYQEVQHVELERDGETGA